MRNPELDAIKTKEKEAFTRKQAAFQKYLDAKDRASAAHEVMQAAWGERTSTRERMNHEYEILQGENAHHNKVWSEYESIRDSNNARIAALRVEADREHNEMEECFRRASEAYTNGNRAEAPVLSSEGRDHKERRNALNAEIRELIQEIRDAKASAQRRAPKTDSSAYLDAKAEYQAAKAKHGSAEAEFKRLKDERDAAKAEFDSAHAEHLCLKEEFNSKLEAVKAANQRDHIKDSTKHINTVPAAVPC